MHTSKSFVHFLLAALLFLGRLTAVWAQNDDDDDDSNDNDYSSPANGGILSAPTVLDAQGAIWMNDPEFRDIIGERPQISLAARLGAQNPGGQSIQRNSFAYEGGVWIPERDEVWFTSEINRPPSFIHVLNLKTNTVFEPKLSEPIINAVGGYYFNGLIYIAAFGNRTAPHGIFTVDPFTGKVQTLTSTYGGRPFNAPDDVAVISRGNYSSIFFTDTNYGQILRISGPSQLPVAVYRYDFWTSKSIPVITAEQINPPNGVCVDVNQTTLYVTQTPSGSPRPGDNSDEPRERAIYAFDIDNQWNPVNMRKFGHAERGIPDGIKCDDMGRVWTAEGTGIVVRNSAGDVIGGFRAEALKVGVERATDIANFALAGDELVVLALDQIWRVKLAQKVVSPERYRGGFRR